MDLKSKIKELREIIPIPISEASTLLKEYDGDVLKSAEFFKNQSINFIIEQTGADIEIVKARYILEKYDINRSISMIREDLYDQNYKPIEGVSLDNLNKVRLWIAFVEDKDFATSLDYKEIDVVIATLEKLTALKEIAQAVKQAKKIKNKIFEGYSDDLSIDEFVRRNVKLDDDLGFRKTYDRVVLSIIPLKEEINRHRRNLQ